MRIAMAFKPEFCFTDASLRNNFKYHVIFAFVCEAAVVINACVVAELINAICFS